jgi:TPR repeat protein
MIRSDISKGIPSGFRTMTLAALVAVGLGACEGEDFQAQVAAAEEAKDYTTVIALWRTRADGGDTNAILEIAALYETGPEAIQDFSLAAEAFAQAVDLGDTTAMVRLGELYERGQGIDQDVERAIALYTQAADLANPEGFFRIGKMLTFNSNVGNRSVEYAKAMVQYEKAAEMGLVDAQVEMANHLFSGFRVPRDSEAAVKWYRMAAEHGHAGAQFRLGFMLRSGIGVAEDKMTAYAWFRLAAAQGLDAATDSLIGLGVELGADALAEAQALSREFWDLYVAPFQGGV